MRSISALLIIFIASCSQMVSRHSVDERDLSEIVKVKVNETRELIKTSKNDLALQKLLDLRDEELNNVEKAIKYNLKGVIFFNMNQPDRAIKNFEVAEKYSPKDTQLYSQVQLNMASGHFKLNEFSELKNCLVKINKKMLNDSEKKKHAQLEMAYGKKIENHFMIVSSSLRLMGELKTYNDVLSSNLYLPLSESFKKITEGQKIELLEEFSNSNNIAVAYLAQVEAERRYVGGDKSGAEDVVAWMKSEFGSNGEVGKFIKEFELRLSNTSRLSLNDIGLVLPLSGENAEKGQKILSGVEAGLKVLGLSEGVKIHTKDAMDSPAQGAQSVVDLIREHKVSFIIGGLISEQAKAEYLEARKYGVLYISLSSVDLPRQEKNHHLIEVQGSIESQVDTLLSDEMIKKFGTRLGIIFPNNESGKAYADEVWRKAAQKNVEITSFASFLKNSHEYRDVAQLFLGLKFQRERSEELNILEDVYSLEKSSIRRVQTLPPVLDFDWVFLASNPKDATILIPTLGYYDANRIRIVGTPTWGMSPLTNPIVKEQKNIGTLYFVGDDQKDINLALLKKFEELNHKQPTTIEILGLDAMKLGAEVLNATGESSGRDEFDAKMKEKTLKGVNSTWSFQDGVWLKKMNPMVITRGEVMKLFRPEGI